jgi:hypothetical protein
MPEKVIEPVFVTAAAADATAVPCPLRSRAEKSSGEESAAGFAPLDPAAIAGT